MQVIQVKYLSEKSIKNLITLVQSPLFKMLLQMLIVITVLGCIAEVIHGMQESVVNHTIIVLQIKLAKILALMWLAYESINMYLRFPKTNIPAWWQISFSFSLAWLCFVIIILAVKWFLVMFPSESMVKMNLSELNFYPELRMSLLSFSPVMLFVFFNMGLAKQLQGPNSKKSGINVRVMEIEKKISYFIYFVDGPAIALLFAFSYFSWLIYNTIGSAIYAILFLNGSTATIIALSAFVGPIIDHRLEEEKKGNDFWLAEKIKSSNKQTFLELAKEHLNPFWWKPEEPFFKIWYKDIAEELGYLHSRQKFNQTDRTEREIAGIKCLTEKYLTKENGRKLEELIHLDVPCGYGRHLYGFARMFKTVHGVDVNSFYINQINKEHAELISIGKLKTYTVNILEMDQCQKLVTCKGEVDLITNLWTSFGFFEHEDDDIKVLQQWSKFLRPGGIVVVHSDINPGDITNDVWSKLDIQEIPESDQKIIIREEYDKSRSAMIGFWIREQGEEREVSPPFQLRVWDENKWELVAEKAGLRAVAFENSLDSDLPLKGVNEFVVILQKPLT